MICNVLIENWPTFLRGTLMPNPLSGSFFPFKAGSPSGSTPKCQSAQVSLTETIILKQKDKRNNIGKITF